MIETLKHSNPFYFYTGLGFIGLGIITLILIFFDSTQVSGINRWIKPTKFAFSIGLYIITLIYVFDLLPVHWITQIAGSIIIITMVGEIICTVLQASRAVASHFNTSTPFDAKVFSIMGVLIFINTFILIILMLIIIARPEIDLTTKVAFVAALGSILIASYFGVKMVSINHHHLYPEMSGRSVPFLGWNIKAGDLRIPHFIGLHGLQIIPLVAFVMQQKQYQHRLSMLILFIVLYYAFIFLSIPIARRIGI